LKISIIIPVYNAEGYIEQCILSALEQNYLDKEIIVVDNESTDDSYQTILNLNNKVGGFKIGQTENIYKYSWKEPTQYALSNLMAKDSEYFMFLAADDFLEKDFISNCFDIINKAPDKIKLLQSPIRFCGAWQHDQKYDYKSIEEFKQQFLMRCPVNTPTIIWHRSFYESGIMNRVDSNLYAGADDYMLYGHLANDNNFIYPAPKWLGYNYRIHDSQATWGMHKDYGGVDAKIQEFWRKRW